ncbi:hypothetical protein EDD86DRAFT_245970 [Gorgonomyces haynaldii]|nr:hypothetical protein EDD86DRAFT_245970 [Gorgonomyces haynaldii]
MSEIPQVQQLRDKLLLLQQQSQANQSKIRHLEELLDGFSELFATKNPNQVLVQYRQVLKENIQLKETINMYEQGMEVVMNKYRQSVLEKSRPVQLQYQESSDLETENLYLKEELDKAMSRTSV